MIDIVRFFLVYEFKDGNKAKIYYKSLLPEFERGFPGVELAKINLENNHITIQIETKSLARGRAIFNSINRWLISMEDVSNKLEVRQDESATSA